MSDGAAAAGACGAAVAAPPVVEHQRGRKRKAPEQQQRDGEAADAEQQPTENAYELQRRQRIERNRQILQELGVDDAAAEVQRAINRTKRSRASSKPKAPTSDGPPPEPSRKSGRLAGQAAISAEQANSQVDAAEAADLRDPDHASLLTQEEYFRQQGLELAAWESDGKYKGWVSPEVCEMYGIAGSAAEAWESNGGGKFTRKPDMKGVPTRLGWSGAKAFAATMLKKNPNTFFYRHVAPHEAQAQGEWTQDEHDLFMRTAKQHGVGDKWGLFASHIPRRVGYQCSAYYRDVVVARGLVRDKRFRMTRGGRAVFVG